MIKNAALTHTRHLGKTYRVVIEQMREDGVRNAVKLAVLAMRKVESVARRPP